MRRRSASLVSLSVLAAGIALPGSAVAAPTPVGSIGPNESVFWEGGDVGSSPLYSMPSAPNLSAADRCSIDGYPCFFYELTLTGGGERLRVGLDTPSRDDTFELSVTAPGGATSSITNGNKYSVELFLGAPTKGTYTIRVLPVSAEYAHFRMRAKLERSVPLPKPNARGELLPDIAVTRLWEFGFAAPANPLNGLFPPDDINPPLTVAGASPVSCAIDETAEDGAQRCLRYSFGMANLGPGAFRVRYGSDRLAESPAKQCIELVKPEAVRSKPSGSTSWHKTHGHTHYNDFIYHELFRVDRRTHKLRSVGNGKKLGYSPADQGMPEWTRFDQSPAGSSSQNAGNCAPELEASLGMSAGWGDSYRYQRPGNYVEFGTNGDGYYVAITTGDPRNLVREADESNNTAYAYLQVLGEQVRLIESGRGRSPWDPDKIVFEQ